MDEALITVIIPVRNEQDHIESCLQRLQDVTHEIKIIVVDGQSHDQTVIKAKTFEGVDVLHSAPGRGAQQNLGLSHVDTPYVMFLHVDVELPQGWPQMVMQTLQSKTMVAGAFQILTIPDPQRTSWADPFLFLANLRSRYTRLPYGDQCLFAKTHVLKKAGGYPEQDLFEDYECAKRLSKQGKIKILKEKVLVSGRRMQQRPIYFFLMINLMPLMYKLGVSIPTLKKWYSS